MVSWDLNAWPRPRFLLTAHPHPARLAGALILSGSRLALTWA